MRTTRDSSFSMITSFPCLTAQYSTLHPLLTSLLKPDLTLYVEDNYCRGISSVTTTCNHQSYYTIVTRRIKVKAGGGGGGAAATCPKFGAGSPPPPPPQKKKKKKKNWGQFRFFEQQETFGQSQFLKKFPFFFEEIDIFYFNLKSA